MSFIDWKKTAVLILDVQNDFCDEQGAFQTHLGWDATPLRAMVVRLQPFLAKAREEGALIVFSQMMNDAVESPKNLRDRLVTGAEADANSWPFGLKRGSWGYQLFHVVPEAGDVVLEKKTYDFFSNVELLTLLRSKGIETVVVTGLYAEVCVFSTAQSAFTHGFRVIVPSDLVASVVGREAWSQSALQIIQNYIGETTSSQE